MDEYDVDSKNTDSLDFLLLPVKRADNILYKEFLSPGKNCNLRANNKNQLPKQSDLETLTYSKLTVNNRYHNSSLTIQSSVSNQENCIKQQQERIVYKGRKKVYHTIKTIDSSHSCDIKYTTKYEYSFNKQNQINESLNMDKNVRKEKKRNARLKVNNGPECSGSKCAYSYKNQEFDDVEGRKSRVTIFGQLGLTPDDQYVLNCAATLNDKPIKTNFMHPYMDNNKSFYRSDTNSDMEAMATQATQVNFNFSKQYPTKAFKNKSVQCYCNSTQRTDIETYVSNKETDDIELKQCQSPLVVISVYPRQDSVEIVNKSDPIKIIRHQATSQNKLLRNTNQGNNFRTMASKSKNQKIEHIFNTSERKLTRSRSPSPPSNTVLKEKSKNADKKVISTHNSPRKKSPLRQKDSEKSVHKLIDVKQNVNNQGSKNKRKPDLRQKPQFDIRETNKEQVKKALVDSFLKNIGTTDTNFVKSKVFGPKDDASKITIDINGENEHYNVLLEQRKFDTGLSVRKTMKDQSRERYKEKNLENSRKKPLAGNLADDAKDYCDTTQYSRQSNSPQLLPTESKLNVKDSLEICHRREKRNSSRLEPKQINHQSNVNNARNKHYRGDNCSISDPNERDQEIRKLLGILREKRYQHEEETKRHSDIENEDYCTRNKCFKDLTVLHKGPKLLLNTRLRKKSKNENILHSEHQLRYYNDKNIKVNALDKPIIVKRNNGITIKTQNVLSSYTKNENRNLNPNVLVILQVEKKTKPIILTKKQYERLKRSIKRTSSKKSSLEKRRRYDINAIDCNVVSIGNIKMKRKIQKQLIHFNRETQTESTSKCVEIQYESQSQNKVVNRENEKFINNNVLNVTEKLKAKNEPRQTLSSMEVRYASVEYIKHVSKSSSHLKNNAFNCYQHNMHKDTKSIHTIFKGHRKCATPNLGTSTFSLNSDSTNGSNHSTKPPLYSGDGKVKKPFLKRLLSCLVMRSQTSGLKETVKQRNVPSKNSSLDSYHISTSLGALKMSSSLYDTSASFYSNHSITPINKTRRGFLNSVRGFLTIRKN